MQIEKKTLFISALLTAGEVLAEINARAKAREISTCRTIAEILAPYPSQSDREILTAHVYALRNPAAA